MTKTGKCHPSADPGGSPGVAGPPAGVLHRPDLRFRVRFADDGSLRELFFLQYQRPSLAPVLEAALGAGDCFFDVGANIGVYACWAARCVRDEGQVHAFEPLASTRVFLRELIEHNALGQVTVVPEAVGETEQTLRIWRIPGSSGISSAVRRDRGEPVETHCTTLDTYVERAGCPIPALVKIDVEGFELAVMRGARRLLSRDDAPAVVFESNYPAEEFRDIARLLTDAGFALFGLTPNGLRKLDETAVTSPSLNTLAARPEHHARLVDALSRVRFRRNQNT